MAPVEPLMDSIATTMREGSHVQVFLPTEYFSTLGYQSLDEFDASSDAVDTEDGQPTTPNTTKRKDGILINLGVKHYSAPNPSVTFAVKSTKSAKAATALIKYKGARTKTWRASGAYFNRLRAAITTD